MRKTLRLERSKQVNPVSTCALVSCVRYVYIYIYHNPTDANPRLHYTFSILYKWIESQHWPGKAIHPSIPAKESTRSDAHLYHGLPFDRRGRTWSHAIESPSTCWQPTGYDAYHVSGRSSCVVGAVDTCRRTGSSWHDSIPWNSRENSQEHKYGPLWTRNAWKKGNVAPSIRRSDARDHESHGESSRDGHRIDEECEIQYWKNETAKARSRDWLNNNNNVDVTCWWYYRESKWGRPPRHGSSLGREFNEHRRKWLN